MATYVNDLRLTELATGEGSGTWGTTTNTNLELIGEALGFGTQDCFTTDADATTTVADGATDPARAMYFKVTSSATLTATRTLTIGPNTVSRVMWIENATTGSQSIAISQGSGANVTIATGKAAVVYLDGAGATAAVVDAMNLVDPGVTDTLAEVLTAGNTTGGTDIAVGTGDDITFADSSKAIFGAGSDLQIYHDGSDSIIDDNGTGSLKLQTGASTKLEVTSTGIDVTGTVTADGLTVDGATVLNVGDEGTLQVGPTTTVADENQTIEMRGSNGSNELQRFQIANRGEDGRVDFKYGRAGATPTKAISIGAGTGDISFYEDTGTTPKFFWDASAESLGIGTTSPNRLFSVEETSGACVARFTSSPTDVTTIQLGNTNDENEGQIQYDNSNNFMSFTANASERMRIDSSGRLLIGLTTNATAGPVQAEVTGTGTSFQTNAAVFGAVAGAAGREVPMIYGSDGTNAALISMLSGNMGFFTQSTERARIDSSGNLLVGTTDDNVTNNSTEAGAGINVGTAGIKGLLSAARWQGAPAVFNRMGNDGEAVYFFRDGNNVGNITTFSSLVSGIILDPRSSGTGVGATNTDSVVPINSSGNSDATKDLGISSARWRNLYLSGGVYLGGTGAANLLDDYEYGDYQVTFTPSGGGSITVSGSHDDLKYTKIGSRVFVTGKVDISAVSSPSGYIAVNLPFVIHNSGTANDGRRFSGSIWVVNAAIETYKFQLYGIEGESSVRIYNGSGTSLASTAANQFSGDEGVAFSFNYETTP